MTESQADSPDLSVFGSRTAAKSGVSPSTLEVSTGELASTSSCANRG